MNKDGKGLCQFPEPGLLKIDSSHVSESLESLSTIHVHLGLHLLFHSLHIHSGLSLIPTP